MHSIRFGLAFSVLMAIFLESEAYIMLYNITCIPIDKEFLIFRACSMELLSEKSAKVNVHGFVVRKEPYNNITVNFGIIKKGGGFQAYNYTYDFCRIVKGRKSVPFLGLLLDLLKTNSNLNHSCPYSDDIIIKDKVLRTSDMKYVPLPIGDYIFYITFGVYNIWRGKIVVDIANHY